MYLNSCLSCILTLLKTEIMDKSNQSERPLEFVVISLYSTSILNVDIYIFFKAHICGKHFNDICGAKHEHLSLNDFISVTFNSLISLLQYSSTLDLLF